MEKISFTYNFSIVLIAIFISICTCFTTFDLLGRIRNTETSTKQKFWLASSAGTMGIGIWSMHFVSMLAIKADAQVIYNVPITLFSLFTAITMSYASFYVITIKKFTFWNLVLSAVLMGLGISFMHYIGMYGVVTNASIEYNYFTVLIAIIAAIGFSSLSYYFFSKVIKESFSIFQIPTAVILALGTVAAHYIGMSAITLYSNPYHLISMKPKALEFVIESNAMLAGIVIINFTIVGLMYSLSIKDRKSHEEKMTYMAYYDQLTGLPNRLLFLRRLRDSIQRLTHDPERELAVMFIDLDHFKLVNDAMGHQYGDQFLIQVSDRLTGSLQEDAFVARHGGDEFILLLNNTNAEKTAEEIFHAFTKPFLLKGKEFYTTVSIGISLYPKDGADEDTLLKHAYKAMHSAQKHGFNNYQFFVHEDDKVLDRNIKIEQGLKKALHNNEFELYYQPQVNLKNKQIIGVEALLRWQHPELGNISPYEFIPMAEATGMIIPIGKWVIQEACKQVRRWQSVGIRIKIAVNVSALQFEDHQFVEIINEALQQNLLPPKYLELEITESVMQKINQTFAIIGKLKNIGIKVSIDDFGTGYSSLSVLSNLPIDVIKIDKSFVHQMMDNMNSASLVKTMIEMGNNLNFGLIAEGVETDEQAEFLVKNGCHFGQGYLYSPPMKKEEIEKLLYKLHVV